MEELTSANAAPYLKTFSKALSVDLFITGEYFFSSSLRSWSDKRRDSAYAATISRLLWAVANRHER